jgi:SAM-dependent methyltransferase
MCNKFLQPSALRMQGEQPMRADDPEARLAATIAEVSRELSRTVPPPKAAPYFGLDNDKPYDLSVLETLSSPGIFRKYEIVLLLQSGLGGTARWLSRRLGCRVLGVDQDAARVGAAQALNRRARMTEKVSFAVAAPERLAFRDRVFTHVWLIDPPAVHRTRQVLEEAFRVLRSGAHFALQTLAHGEDSPSALESRLGLIGFIDVRIECVRLVSPDYATVSARARMSQMLTERQEILRVWHPEVLASGLDCVQIFCRRP